MGGYGLILILFALSSGIAAVLWMLATTPGPHAMNAQKAESFESRDSARGETPARGFLEFYVVALLFVVLNMEMLFLYPWAINFRDQGWTGFYIMLTFVTITTLALVYAWKKGAFYWR